MLNLNFIVTIYSFRCIVGESAPHGLVTDPLAVDKKLVPLWRSMARYADLSAQGVHIPPVKVPEDWKL
jgi:hypothetical protein